MGCTNINMPRRITLEGLGKLYRLTSITHKCQTDPVFMFKAFRSDHDKLLTYISGVINQISAINYNCSHMIMIMSEVRS